MKKANTQSRLTAIAITITLVLLSCEDGSEIKVNLSKQPKTHQSQGNSRGTSARNADGSYTFTGQEGDPITLDLAREWTKNYRELNPDRIEAHFFGNEIIKQILNQSECVGIRIYYAIDDKGVQQLLLVGVDATGNNLLPGMQTTDGDGNIIADMSFPCPTYCDPFGL